MVEEPGSPSADFTEPDRAPILFGAGESVVPLLDALGLGGLRVISICLEVEAMKPATLTVCRYVSETEGKDLATILEEYRLQKIEKAPETPLDNAEGGEDES